MKRSLLDATLAMTPEVKQYNYPSPRELLVECGHDADDIRALADEEMWNLFSEEFGGIMYKTMRSINEIEESATIDWFRKQKLNKFRGFTFLKNLKAAAAAHETTNGPSAHDTSGKDEPTTPAKTGKSDGKKIKIERAAK